MYDSNRQVQDLAAWSQLFLRNYDCFRYWHQGNKELVTKQKNLGHPLFFFLQKKLPIKCSVVYLFIVCSISGSSRRRFS